MFIFLATPSLLSIGLPFTKLLTTMGGLEFWHCKIIDGIAVAAAAPILRVGDNFLMFIFRFIGKFRLALFRQAKKNIYEIGLLTFLK